MDEIPFTYLKSGKVESTVHYNLHLLGGQSESEGQVEVCFNGSWYSVCGLAANEASVLCKQLGLTVYPCKQHKDASATHENVLREGYLYLYTQGLNSWLYDARFRQTISMLY